VAPDDLSNLTGLLNRMLQGDSAAGDAALEALYPKLQKIASAKLRRERPDHLLETRALVHEAILRLFGGRSVTVQNRKHFVALVCLLMKRILIDVGRRHDPVFLCLEESTSSVEAPDHARLIALDRVLSRFKDLDPDAYRAFQLKAGAGMTTEEVADALECSTGTAKRRLTRARTWLHKELTFIVAHR
jgi:RNA polymerase sigma factor (TIGR02999 family)